MGVGKVVRSEKEGFKTGDYVYGILGALSVFRVSCDRILNVDCPDHAEYSTPNPDMAIFGPRVFKPEPGLHYSAYVGAGGMPGQTAYFGWKEYANAKAVCSIAFVS